MTKVTNKTFDILEMLASKPEKAFSVTEIAQSSGINKATAGRILIDLLERGYAFQSANRRGYSLGPMAYALAGRGVFRKDIIDASVEFVRHLAHEEIEESVIVATFFKGRRYILVNENGNKEVQPVIDKPWYDGMYYTATGRLLLAYVEEEDLKSYFNTHELPSGNEWEGVDTYEKLQEALANIRRDGFVSCPSCPPTNFHVLAYPIRLRGRVEAALGITVLASSFNEPRFNDIMAKSALCAMKIEAKLNEDFKA